MKRPERTHGHGERAAGRAAARAQRERRWHTGAAVTCSCRTRRITLSGSFMAARSKNEERAAALFHNRCCLGSRRKLGRHRAQQQADAKAGPGWFLFSRPPPPPSLTPAIVHMPNVELIIKSPSRLEQEQPLRLSVPLEGTVRDIKEALSQTHPEHPLPSDQRLIFAGRLLVDGAQTADVLRQVWRCARRMALDSEPHPNSRHKTHEGSLSLCCMCAFASDS